MENSIKTAVITGISSGIGLALTKKLLAEHYTVIGTTRSGRLLDFDHPRLHIVPLEATDEQSRTQAAARIRSLTDSLDLFINNAGTAPDVFTMEPTHAAFTQTLDTNVTGVVFLTELLLPHVRPGGQILFVSSNMGLPRNAAPNGPGYRLSKAAINMYAAMLATRLADQHVRVTPLHPGWVQTKLGGDQAPTTPEQAATGIYQAVVSAPETGQFYNVALSGVESF
ncbi:SDR family NAD(P)-dependent oxidoreductase [Hymenobacter setariae]|uniref:SDR family NAD(P)-dependent oxidoreductase n=1 Tax=Hymenobacter setariae TaxID=2594794 RepID=A0A558BVI4_9BACT|nr:SDR family NAD(P)-dependent oxidoreductase [Hymenobacter setariae]TVT40528.1 SDR family NAD(P)-dependent oxidoreductase [Hymenobacter setariae]